MIDPLRRVPSWLIASVSVACIVFAACFACAASPAYAQNGEPTGLAAALALEKALTTTIEETEPSVVSIARVSLLQQVDLGDRFRPLEGPRELGPSERLPTDPDFIPSRYGTGVIVDRDGLILTNYHVIDEEYIRGETANVREISDVIYVWTSDKKIYRATVKAADPRSDLAVLSINAQNLKPIKFAPVETVKHLKKGQLVVSLGNPHAIARDGSASASWGMISNLARKAAPILDRDGHVSRLKTLHQFGTLIETDLRLDLGTSGGPLLNLQGEMIGLTTSVAALAGGDRGEGFAVPVDETFRRVVETLKQGREVGYGFLGVQPSNLSMNERLRGEHGVRVVEVRANPARDAQLQVGLDVIVAINDAPVFDVDDLMLQVGKLPVEAAVAITVRRGNNKLVKLPAVRLGKYPVAGRKLVTEHPPSWRGVRVDYPTAVERVVLDPFMSDWSNGSVLVVHVESSSPAAAVGLRDGVLITHVGGVRVRSPREFQSAVANRKGPVDIRVANRPEPLSIPEE